MSLTLGFRPPVRDQLVGRTPPFGVAGATGRMVITVLGMVADMELTFIRDRQRAGIKAAKGQGRLQGTGKSGGRCEDPVSYTHLRAHETN